MIYNQPSNILINSTSADDSELKPFNIILCIMVIIDTIVWMYACSIINDRAEVKVMLMSYSQPNSCIKKREDILVYYIQRLNGTGCYKPSSILGLRSYL